MKITKYHNAFTQVGFSENLTRIEKLNIALSIVQNTYEGKAEIWNGGNIFNIIENLDYFISYLPIQREPISKSEAEDRKNARFEAIAEYENDCRVARAESLYHNY